MWRGEGEGHDPDDGDYRFGQQIIVSHDGGDYLSWESRSWLLDADGKYTGPDLRESGFWRVGGDGIPGSIDEEVVELLLTHSSGIVELYYGQALTQSSLGTRDRRRDPQQTRRAGRRRQAPLRHRRGRRPRLRRGAHPRRRPADAAPVRAAVPLHRVALLMLPRLIAPVDAERPPSRTADGRLSSHGPGRD